jgi:hypothetical protein
MDNGGHSGEYEGNQVFLCRKNCGVFVKVCKLNFGVPLREAIQYKYLNQESTEVSSDGRGILVGDEKARKYFAENLFDLEEISLDCCGAGFDGDTDEKYLAQFTQLRHLSLCGNLISSMYDIVRICMQLPTLVAIDVGDNFLKPNSPNLRDVSASLRELRLDDCRLVIEDDFISMVCTHFPNLTHISANGSILGRVSNAFPSTLTSVSFQRLSFRNLKEQSATQVYKLLEWLSIACFGAHIESLDISNALLEVGEIDSLDLPKCLSSLGHVNIACTGLGDWKLISWLADGVPSLRSIRVTGNEFYSPSSTPHRAILTVGFQNLTHLNGAIIRPNGRLEMEKYCAGLLARKDQNACTVISATIQSVLVEKYTNGISASIDQQPTGRSNLMSVYVHSGGPTPLKVRLPRSCTISEVKTIISRKISWPLKVTEMSLSARSGVSRDDADLVVLDGADEYNNTMEDIGVDEEWNVYVSVRDALVQEGLVHTISSAC